MTQQVVVSVLVGVCGIWLAWLGYRFFRPAPGGKACGGGCSCDAMTKPAATAAKEGVSPSPQNSGAAGQRVMMISSDDMRARIKARKA